MMGTDRLTSDKRGHESRKGGSGMGMLECPEFGSTALYVPCTVQAKVDLNSKTHEEDLDIVGSYNTDFGMAYRNDNTSHGKEVVRTYDSRSEDRSDVF